MPALKANASCIGFSPQRKSGAFHPKTETSSRCVQTEVGSSLAFLLMGYYEEPEKSIHLFQMQIVGCRQAKYAEPKSNAIAGSEINHD